MLVHQALHAETRGLLWSLLQRLEKLYEDAGTAWLAGGFFGRLRYDYESHGTGNATTGGTGTVTPALLSQDSR